MPRLRLVGCAVTLAFACGAPSAIADDDEKPPCLAETQRFCRIMPVLLVQTCLQGHASELSERCRKHVSETNDEIARVDGSCGSDLARFCSGPQTYAGQRVECLYAHRDALSRPCQDVFDDLMKK
jgi:hypothetical protein